MQQQSESHAPVCARPAYPASVIPRAALATTTIIASLHLQGMGPTMALPGVADASAFEAYVRDVLAPTLRPGQIVLLDNARIHLSPRIAQIIAAHGCERWFLPSYSPDYSPIEYAFARLKHQWRQAEARTPDALLDAVGRSLPSISAQDAHGFFHTCSFRMETNQVQCF
ncbi:transposase [Roseiflexus sp.]